MMLLGPTVVHPHEITPHTGEIPKEECTNCGHIMKSKIHKIWKDTACYKCLRCGNDFDTILYPNK